jgi:hypothetical protein
MKKNDDYKPSIFAALKKLGPSAPRVLLDEIGGSEKKLAYHLRKLRGTKQLKATGKSAARIYALPAQRLRGATSSPERAINAAPAPHAELEAPLASKTADGRLVLCFAGRAEAPIVLPSTFASPLAELLAADEIPL